MWRRAGGHAGCHEGHFAEVAHAWRLRGGATSTRDRRRLGDELAGEGRHGSGGGWCQRREEAIGSAVLTVAAQGREGFVGGEGFGGGVVRVSGGATMRRGSGVEEARTV